MKRGRSSVPEVEEARAADEETGSSVSRVSDQADPARPRVRPAARSHFRDTSSQRTAGRKGTPGVAARAARLELHLPDGDHVGELPDLREERLGGGGVDVDEGDRLVLLP